MIHYIPLKAFLQKYIMNCIWLHIYHSHTLILANTFMIQDIHIYYICMHNLTDMIAIQAKESMHAETNIFSLEHECTLKLFL